MKSSPVHVLKAITFTLFLATTAAFAQGTLTPPGAPAATMKTLNQIEPRTDILTLPSSANSMYVITQPGSYYLSATFTATAAFRAIEIRTNDVTIDLCGFTIYGNGGYAGILSYGTFCDRIRVLNGRLINWNTGINFVVVGTSANDVLEDLQVFGTTNSSSYGIVTGDGARFTHCQIVGMSGSGSTGLAGGDNCIVEHCKLEKNSNGINVGNHALITDCLVRDSGIFTQSYAIIRNNEVLGARGGADGIRVTDDSLVENNNCNFCSGNGIYMSGGNNRVDGNQTHFNIFGLQSISGTTNFVIRNIAHGNTNGNYNLGPTLAGPIVNGSGTATNHPWANFSY